MRKLQEYSFDSMNKYKVAHEGFGNSILQNKIRQSG